MPHKKINGRFIIRFTGSDVFEDFTRRWDIGPKAKTLEAVASIFNFGNRAKNLSAY